MRPNLVPYPKLHFLIPAVTPIALGRKDTNAGVPAGGRRAGGGPSSTLGQRPMFIGCRLLLWGATARLLETFHLRLARNGWHAWKIFGTSRWPSGLPFRDGMRVLCPGGVRSQPLHQPGWCNFQRLCAIPKKQKFPTVPHRCQAD